MSSAIPTFPLTGFQKNDLHNLVESPPLSPSFAHTEANPHLRVFVVHFDGTQNDRAAVPEGEQATLVADGDRKMRECEGYGSDIVSHYIHGVGTRTNPIRRMLESATGAGCESRAEWAHEDLIEQAQRWRAEDPQAEIHVHAVGFSRGAATALHFLNLVHERGAFPAGESVLRDDKMAPGNVLSSAVLYDTVSTGQGNNLTLTVPNSTAAVLHLVAGGEERTLFPVRAIASDPHQEASVVRNAWMRDAERASDGTYVFQRIQEITLPGARHSDVGGSYVGGHIREVSAYLAHEFQRSLGLPIKPVKPTFMEIQKAYFHDSRFVRVSDDLEDRQGSLRHVEAVQEEKENNRFFLESEISGIPQSCWSKQSPLFGTDVQDKSRVRRMHFGGFGASDEDRSLKRCLGMDFSAKLTLADSRAAAMLPADEFLAMGLDCKSSHLLGFDVRNGRLTFHGKVVQGCPPLEEIREGLLLAQNAGKEPKPVEVKVKLRRFGRFYDAKQDRVEPLAIAQQKPDPWPKELRNAFLELNEGSALDTRDASRLMNNAIFSVARALYEESIAGDHVSIEPRKLLENTSVGLVRKNMVLIRCVDQTGRHIGVSGGVKRLEDESSLLRMKQLSHGLELLHETFRERGFELNTYSRHVIRSTQTEPEWELASMRPISVEPKTSVEKQQPTTFRELGRYFSGVLGIRSDDNMVRKGLRPR